MLLVCAAVLLHPVVGHGATYEIDPVHSSVSFTIRHLVGKVRGEFTKFEGQVEFDPKSSTKGSVGATIEVKSIDTRNDRRDEHLRSAEFFDAAKFPTMTFKSRRVTATKTKNQFRVLGDLTLHGTTRRVHPGFTELRCQSQFLFLLLR
jgi:polyisoprenoid-binding protein YceI